MKKITKTKQFKDSPEVVFNQIDDLGVTGMHMTKSSAMMMGSKLKLTYLSDITKGLGSKYKWTGKMMGLEMDFTVEVTKWIAGKEKTWETIGVAKLIIYSWYQMHLEIFQKNDETIAELSITYERPKGFFNRILSFFLADWYCRWCLKNMLNDSEKTINEIVN